MSDKEVSVLTIHSVLGKDILSYRNGLHVSMCAIASVATNLEYTPLYLSYSTPRGHPLASTLCVVGVVAGGSHAGSTRLHCTTLTS
jgi:hypothetical protein